MPPSSQPTAVSQGAEEEAEEEEPFVAKSAPPLRSARLLLRPLLSSDETAMFALRADRRVMQWSLHRRPDTTLAQTRAYMRHWSAPTALNLVIEELEDPERPQHVVGTGLCGVVGLIGDGHGRLELGYSLLPRVWGRGYASEAVRAARDAYAADYAGVRSAVAVVASSSPSSFADSVIWAETHHDNEPSRRVLARCGFVKQRDAEDEYGPFEEWSCTLPSSKAQDGLGHAEVPN